MLFQKICVLAAILIPANALAVPLLHTDEGLFQAAAGAVTVDDFEGGAVLDPVPAVAGGTFDTLSNGSPPRKYDFSAGGTDPSGGNRSLMNNDKLTLPGLGDIVLNANPGESWSAIGFWDIGGDDSIQMTLFDAQDNILAMATTMNDAVPDFIGFTMLSGATKASFSAVAGNGWFAMDDLQYNTVDVDAPVPLPAPFLLLLVPIAGLAGLRLTRRS